MGRHHLYGFVTIAFQKSMPGLASERFVEACARDKVGINTVEYVMHEVPRKHRLRIAGPSPDADMARSVAG